jgi:leucyl aminopeptidase (aminopeptidase T)
MSSFDLDKLLRDVFQPAPGEPVVVMVDTPHGRHLDTEDWADRRRMAEEWRAAFARIGTAPLPLLSFPATGASNADLPEYADLHGVRVAMADVLGRMHIAVALTQFSATAPLAAYTRRFPGLRGASMPGVLRRMTQTALAADYLVVARKARILADLLTDAVEADVVFSTGHALRFDLRHRTAHADDGLCRHDRAPPRVINLPSGEAFIVPYEGEIAGDPSRTEGEIPLTRGSELAVLEVRANTITGVHGDHGWAGYLRQHYDVDPARRNVAELGLGCNDRAIVAGNILEDEKAGFHWAYGRSEHLGGVTGPGAFSSPAHVLHYDVVYAPGCPLGIASLTLRYPDRETEVIMRDSAYTIF